MGATMMNMKDSIFGLLQDANLSVNDIAKRAGIDANNARVYVNRLRAEGKVRELAKEGKAKVYTVANKQAVPVAAANPGILASLRFLNEFFKTNAEYLFVNPAIVKYIEDNGEKFTEVENLCQA